MKFLAAALACAILPARATDFYVNGDTGSDANDGLAPAPAASHHGPFKTIRAGVKALAAGDTLNLAPTAEPYPESLEFYHFPDWFHAGGGEGKPLTVDGHGATLTGAAPPCDPSGWKAEREGIYSRNDYPVVGALLVNDRRVSPAHPQTDLNPGEWRYNAAFQQLYYHAPAGPIAQLAYADGHKEDVPPNRWTPSGVGGTIRLTAIAAQPSALIVGGTSLPPTPLKERLQPGEFTFDAGTLYYHPPADADLAKMRIQCIVREMGVKIGGAQSHITVRNLRVTHVWDDGFNVHGSGSDLVFENITAFDCFDQGFSSHDTSRSIIHHAWFVHDGSGVVNVNHAKLTASDLFIAYCDTVGYINQQQTEDEVRNLILVDNGGELGSGKLTCQNVLVLDDNPKKPGGIGFSVDANVKQLTAVGCINVGIPSPGALNLAGCVFGGGHMQWASRDKEPAQRLGAVSNLVVDPRVVLALPGTTPPVHKTLAEWLQQVKPGAATIATIPGPEQILADGGASMPKNAGCSPDLYLQARQDLKTCPGIPQGVTP